MPNFTTQEIALPAPDVDEEKANLTR